MVSFWDFWKKYMFLGLLEKIRLLEADPENLDFWNQKLTIEKSFSQNFLFSSKIYFSGADVETQPAPTPPNSAQIFIV
eukprot:COSAG01_NODE_10487_length_2153_cov_15.611490_1_plen_78_part_00